MLGVVSFTLCVLGCQLLGTLAAITGGPLLGGGALALVLAVLACIVWFVSRRLPSASGGCGEGLRVASSGTAFLTVAMLGLASLALGVVLGTSGPPRGWDVLTYHLPRAVAWLQHGNLGHYGFSPAFYPGNGEIAMLVTLFSGSDRLTPLVQLPFALLGAVALYGLARELGARARWAALAPLAFLLAPIVVFQAGIAKNDLIVAGVVIAGAYLLTRALGPRPPSERKPLLVTGGLALGLAAGTKYTVFPFVAATVVFLALALAVMWDRKAWEPEGASGTDEDSRRGGALRFVLSWTGLFTAAVALPSAFWFVQNAFMTGNPFAPMLIKIGGWVVFGGGDIAATFGEQQLTYVSGPASWLAFPWIDRAIVGDTEVVGTYSASVGFGAVFAAFLVPSLAVLAHRAARWRSGPTDLRAPALLIFVLLGVFAWWFGGFHLPRYVWPVLALAFAPMALLFDRLRGLARSVLIGVFAVAALVTSAETARIVFDGNDFMSSRLTRGTTSRSYYHMPDLIYELPAGTRILINEPTDDTYHRTFRYPLVGDLPGNDVVMAGDVGVELDLASADTGAIHRKIRTEGIEYVFSRTLISQPRRTWFDTFPDRYAAVIDTIERPYRWHRSGMVAVHESGAIMGYPAVTRIYRVLGD
jgi:hypothetical protein